MPPTPILTPSQQQFAQMQLQLTQLQQQLVQSQLDYQQQFTQIEFNHQGRISAVQQQVDQMALELEKQNLEIIEMILEKIMDCID